MRTLLAFLAVLVTSAITLSCATSPTPVSANRSVPPVVIAPTPESPPQSDGEITADDVVPDFTGFNFNAYPLQNIRPRIVEISVETQKSSSARAPNKVKIELAVREAIQSALKRCNITVVSRSSNKVQFVVKDCQRTPESAQCVAIDAQFRSPRFELEVGGYSHNNGDATRAYHGAINAVLERLNKQLEIVGLHQ